jgi:phage repressor protein C with HTH and peptisase S24 domain
VLFNATETAGENIFVVSVGNDLLVKRVVRDTLKNSLTLISENQAYPPRLIEGEDLESVRIAGKVIAVIHRL